MYPLTHLSAQLRAWMLLIVFRFSTRRQVDGIELVVPTAEHDAATFFEKTQQAFDLLRKADPRRWARIQRDLRRVVLINGGGEFFFTKLRAYVMDVPSLRLRSSLEIASSLVHEATHARLYRAGIEYRVPLRDRIEAVCVRQEVAFLRHLPDTQDLIADKESSLKSRWWSDDSMHQRRLKGLRAHGMPRLFVSLFDWIGRTRKAP